MLAKRFIPSAATGLTVAALVLALPARAQSPTEEFHHAYYLQHEKGNLEGALALYERVAGDRGASAELRQAAKQAVQAVAEELGSSDFARLMPEDTIFYLELNRPGEQLRTLLGKLGLLSSGTGGGGGPSFGISPALIDGLCGMRGAAIAITDIDPRRGPKDGVLILHPGDLDVVRGLLETSLPLAGQAVDPIGGYPTYSVEGHAFVTLTSRLLIASADRDKIDGVIAHTQGRGGRSLADNDGLAGAMAMRGDDLMFTCVNLAPLMPMIKQLIEAQTRRNPEARAALEFLDIESTRSLAARAGVDENGISFDVALELDEGHRNLAFNLLRMPPIEDDTLAMVPAGAAFFAAGAINRSQPVPPGLTDARGEPVVTLMDFGREFFANIAGFALYAMPEVQQGPWPMPEAALALRVNDPERSRALWNFVLKTAQTATGGQGEAVTRKVGDVQVERYEIRGVPVFLATHGNDMLVSASENAIRTSIELRAAGRTVLKDPAFAGTLEQLRDGSTRAAAANLGRCSQIASHFMSERERREMMPFASMLTDTSVSLSFQQTANRLGASGRITGLPDIGPVVSQLIEREMGRGRRISAAAPSGAVGDLLQGKFEQLHTDGQHEAARAVAQALGSQQKDPLTLNNFAWALLTEDRYGAQYDDVALAISKTSNELSDWGNWYYLDTYATALSRQGRIEEAIEIQRKAVELGGDDPRVAEARETLARLQKAAAAKQTEEPRRVRVKR